MYMMGPDAGGVVVTDVVEAPAQLDELTMKELPAPSG